MSRSLLLLLAACGTASSDAPTYHADVEPILASRCATCHREGDVAPFPLTTWDEVEPRVALVQASIESGSMPPWQPADDCTTYVGDQSLTDAEKATVLAWAEAGGPRGEPVDAEPIAEPPALEPDLLLTVPEPYVPTREPDDYRCQLIDWPLDSSSYIVDLQVQPDQRALVHHVILFAVPAAQRELYEGYDAQDPGPGYSCFGGPSPGSMDRSLPDGVSLTEILAALQSGEVPPELEGAGGGLGSTRWIGAWVPGSSASSVPDGAGLRMDPGDLVIAQFHYNTLSAAPVADQSSVAIALADEVEREGVIVPVTDLGWITGLPIGAGPMTIPAGQQEVAHTAQIPVDGLLFGRARASLGLPADSDLLVHGTGHHMHQLGTWGRQAITHADGTESCLLEIDDWDFSWQGSYRLETPVRVGSGDALSLGCGWDNSAANQPIVDGQVLETQDVSWGEGTTDEMCLSTLFVTAP